MIKRIELLVQPPEQRPTDYAARLSRGPLPLRAAVCFVLHDVAGCAAPHDAILITWFRDIAAAGSSQADAIIAEEHVLRGADWLDQRWREATPKYKHMALARRAPGLTLAAFSERWRNRPGRVGSGEIPAEARGQAYIQNHPLQSSRYDAVNEVYFDSLAAMQPRLAFFAKHDAARVDADLVSEAYFAVVEEHVLR